MAVRFWVHLTFVGLLSLLGSSAWAQATRVYIVPQSDTDEIARAIDEARTSFVAPLTADGTFAVAADMEIERQSQQTEN